MRSIGNVVAVGMGWVLVIGSATVLAAQSSAASPVPKSDHDVFARTWKLNAEASESFREKMQQARGGERRGPGGPGGGGGGAGRGGGGYGGGGRGRQGGRGGPGMEGDPGSGGGGEGMRETMRRLEEPSEVLTIKLEDGAFLVGDDTGAIRRLYPDGRAMKTDNGQGEVRSRWQGADLVTETIPARGPRVKETFAVSPDRGRLFVTVHFEPRWGGAVDVRRVYDAAETR